MKFLENTPFDSLNHFLANLDLGKSTIQGSLEAYLCKYSGDDRKNSFSLEQEILSCKEHSSNSDSLSPVNTASDKSSRKTLVYLILTISHMYPDYDFSAVQAHLFFRMEALESFKKIFEMYTFEASEEWVSANGGGTSLMDSVCKAIDDVVKLDECEIYSYDPDFDEDPFLEDRAIWSFNFFFYNKKLRRIVSFRFCCLSNLSTEDFLSDRADMDYEDEEIFTVMDI